jgi:hypothetical protein
MDWIRIYRSLKSTGSGSATLVLTTGPNFVIGEKTTKPMHKPLQRLKKASQTFGSRPRIKTIYDSPYDDEIM